MNNIFVKKYKCFGENVKLEQPSLINLIIGRNNSGKTTFTHIVEYIYSNASLRFKINNVSVEYTISEDDVRRVFTEGHYRRSSLGYDEGDQLYYGKALIGKPLLVRVQKENQTLKSFQLDHNQETIRAYSKDGVHYSNADWSNLANVCVASTERKHFYRLQAERNIVSETSSGVLLQSNGSGATSIVDRYLNVDGYDYSIIATDLLNDINSILEGENHYSQISVVTNEQSATKSICLFENGQRIKIEDMGSGLKTIILTLLILKLNLNHIENNVFVFEELENNLHPEIQRRLFNYIYDFCIKYQCQVFITSHSHVAINCFYGRDQASIYHVHKNEENSSIVEKVESYLEKTMLLDDLGVKASDVFQANGIIWVEGPSDRVYIKKWLSLVNPGIQENVDYSFLYYGGKNLAHYTADEVEDLIRIMLVNRNSLIVMDSDIDDEDEPIRATKLRVKEEFEKKKMYVWVTSGREIENYISANDLGKKYPQKQFKQIGRFEKFSDYIKETEENFESKKVEFAKSVDMDNESLNILDLKVRISQIVKFINKWNNRK